MADSAYTPYVHWVCPEMRGQLSITHMHIPRRLKKSVRQMKIAGAPYEIRIDYNFHQIIEACAKSEESRPETWINANILEAFCTLHSLGYAHSVECWQEGELVGGLYGLALGGAFFGESMFSRQRDASKVCLVHLVARLKEGGFALLDTQFVNEHLKQFGVYEIPHKQYIPELKKALKIQNTDFLLKEISEFELLKKYLSSQK